jgi:purine-binding chemotaxis protein CheW
MFHDDQTSGRRVLAGLPHPGEPDARRPPGAADHAIMSENSERQLVVFALAGEEYALPINSVAEIIRFVEPRTIASFEPGLRGVIGLRGTIVPIYALAEVLGVAAPEGEPGKIIIVEVGETRFGLTVDDVDEVRTVVADQLEEVGNGASPAIEAIVRVEDRLIVLLEPELLVEVPASADTPA